MLLFLGLIRIIKELYKANSTKKYHFNNLIFYIKRKNFEIYKIKVLQPDIETILAKKENYRKSGPKARVLTFQLR